MQTPVRVQSLSTLFLGAIALAGVLAATDRGAAAQPVTGGTTASAPALWLEPNVGQSDPEVRFLAHSPAYNAVLTATGLDIAGVPERGEAGLKTQLRMTMVGANPWAIVSGEGEFPSKSHYYLGSDPKDWHRDVPQFERVKYDDIYPGVDLVYYGDRGSLKYDFVVAPRRDPGVIRLAFEGAEQIRIDEQGNLVLRTAQGEMRHEKPFIYQELAGARQPVSGRYVLQSENQVGFELGTYDPNHPLVIDPTMVYSVLMDYTGNGVGIVTGNRVAASTDSTQTEKLYVLGTGNAYVNAVWVQCVVVSHHSKSGGAWGRNWQTYLGVSTANTYDGGISADSSGNAYVTGYVGSNGNDVCVYKLNSSGTQLYSATVGGTGDDRGYDIAADSQGMIYVTGYTNGSFPTTVGAYQTTYGGSGDAFVFKRNPSTNTNVYSTYLGGSDNDASSYYMGLGDQRQRHFPTDVSYFSRSACLLSAPLSQHPVALAVVGNQSPEDLCVV